MATKKITELPLVERVSGSQVAGGSVLPIVIGGGLQATTNRISVENFSKFVTAYSAHTGSAGNTFTGPQIINSNVTINGRLTVTEVVAQYETASILFSTGSTKLGDQLTDKHEFTGSTNITGSLFVNGNLLLNGTSLNNSFDRIHQASGSLENFTSSQAARNLVLSTVTGSINQATASIQFQTASLLAFTASQDSRNFTLSQVTGSFNYFYQATASLQAFTASQADRNLVLSIVTGSINQATASLQFHSASVEAQLARIQQATASLELASASFKYFYQSTASLQTFTASQADRNLVLSIVTGSINQATASLQTFTASQDSRNLTLSTVTGSLIGITNGLMAFTAALDNTYATDAQLYQLYQSTRSLELHSGSMIGVTNGLMAYTASNSTLNTGLIGEIGGIEAYTASLKGQAIVSSSTQVQNYDVFGLNSNLYRATGSLIGITNGLMAFTAALDNTYATDAQLYQLYQATASLQFQTASLLQFTASEDSRNFTLSQVTGSFRGEIGGLEAYTASLKGAAIVSSSTQVQNYDLFALNSKLYTVTGSLIGITNGLMAFTAALDNTYATDAQLYQLYQATRSIELTTGSLIGITNGLMSYTASLKGAAIVSSSTQVQNYDLFALNSNLYNSTGSIKGEIAGIEAYTASLKGAAIVSSSQQITNYYKFAETASANTFYSTNTFYNTSSFLGVVGIGTSLPLSKFEVYAGADATSNIILWGQTIRNQGNGAATGYGAGLKLKISSDVEPYKWAGIAGVAGTGYSNQTDLVLYAAATSIADATEKVRVSGDGYLRLAGGGIQFNGDTAAANSLNDYEEGTLTGTITCGTSGTVTLDAGYNTLSYTKIGGVVHVFGNLSVTSVSSPVGYFTIPLPFACVNLGDSAGTTVANIVVNGTNTANTSDFVGWIDETQSNVIVRLGNATGVQNTSANELKALTDIYLQVTYRTT